MKEFDGSLSVASSNAIDRRLINGLAKAARVEMKDIVTSAVSCSLHTLFAENEDKSTNITLLYP